MLTPMNLQQIADLCGGQLLGENLSLARLETDTRKDLQDVLFLALRGEHFDGNDYAEDAMAKGARAVLVDRPVACRPAVLVSDAKEALAQIARFQRLQFKGKVVAITGSNGKTTVKEWLAQGGETHWSTLKTISNNNNQIGVPLTLLSLKSQHQLAVVEAGTSFPGEIAKLGNMIVPDVTILTNASGSHFEGFGDVHSIAVEKGNLISSARDDGHVVLNRDDPSFSYWMSLVQNRSVLSFGLSSEADLYVSQSRWLANGSDISFVYQGCEQSAHIPVPGKHQVYNAMAVVATLLCLGLSLQEAVKSVSKPVFVPGRMQFEQTKSQAMLINDCYNASPKSVEAAIDVLVSQDKAVHCLVLGALGELGAMEKDIHQHLGEYAFKAGVDRLIAIGQVAGDAANIFKSLGGNAQTVADQKTAGQLVAQLDHNHAILVKGSRAARMEKVIEELKT